MDSNRHMLAAACALALAASYTHAQNPSPPIKPGLWESKAHFEVSGQDNSTPAEQMANLSPDRRARLERIARMRGASLDGALITRRCLVPGSLVDGRWHGGGVERGGENECSTKYGDRNASAWRWHDSCTKAESDAQARFDDPEHFTIERVLTSKLPEANGAVFQTKIEMTWIGADCGSAR